MKEPRGVVIGRYNVPTIGHAHTISRVSEICGGVAVGLIDSELWPLNHTPGLEGAKFIEDADEQHERTVFTVQERREMLERTLGDKGVPSCGVVTIGRPELDPSRFTELFPISDYNLCFPSPVEGGNEGFDRHRDEQLPRILGRRATLISTYVTTHNSCIKSRARDEGSSVWSEYMTPSAYRYFLKIGGVERLNE